MASPVSVGVRRVSVEARRGLGSVVRERLRHPQGPSVDLVNSCIVGPRVLRSIRGDCRRRGRHGSRRGGRPGRHPRNAPRSPLPRSSPRAVPMETSRWAPTDCWLLAYSQRLMRRPRETWSTRFGAIGDASRPGIRRSVRTGRPIVAPRADCMLARCSDLVHTPVRGLCAPQRVAALALLPFTFVVSSCGSQEKAGARPAVCGQASPVTHGYVRLKDFDVFGVSSRATGIATDPLFPKYPSALLPQKFRLQARHRLHVALHVTAFDCQSGQAVRFYVKDAQYQRPQPASRFQRSGVRSIDLSWPPPLSAPDPPGWLIAPLFSHPGIGVVTFSRGHKIIEQLTLRICIPKPGPAADC
jgi:hypothetical protein